MPLAAPMRLRTLPGLGSYISDCGDNGVEALLCPSTPMPGAQVAVRQLRLVPILSRDTRFPEASRVDPSIIAQWVDIGGYDEGWRQAGEGGRGERREFREQC